MDIRTLRERWLDDGMAHEWRSQREGLERRDETRRGMSTQWEVREESMQNGSEDELGTTAVYRGENRKREELSENDTRDILSEDEGQDVGLLLRGWAARKEEEICQRCGRGKPQGWRFMCVCYKDVPEVDSRRRSREDVMVAEDGVQRAEGWLFSG